MLLELVIISVLSLRASGVCSGGACGEVAAKITGGTITQRNSRPFQVALYLRVGTAGELGFCGGALLHPEWALTAAHCCFHDEQLVDHVQAILGAHSLYDRYEQGRRVVSVARVTVHPDWSPATFANDLALLRLANTLQLTESINTVRLPYLRTTEDNFAGFAALASGWGIATPGVTFVSPTLREKVMTVMVDSHCNSYYQQQLPDNLVCGFSPGAGTCKGDNGGPLTIISRETDEIVLIGISTFISSEGCNEDQPSVFTRVQRYLPWIRDVTGIELD